LKNTLRLTIPKLKKLILADALKYFTLLAVNYSEQDIYHLRVVHFGGGFTGGHSLVAHWCSNRNFFMPIVVGVS
jgi:hypothetical protein